MKPSLPKGMRDFLPQEVAKRNYITNTIQAVFEKYGFQSIETPVMENLETLTGKYGDEGDKLLFKVLNSGDILKNVQDEDLASKNSKAITNKISEKGLRYDLTVPLARYVVQNQNELVFPFKRYHIAPVWRADRPQKGRYREFYQCDADVIGSESLINEVELAKMYQEVFQLFNLAVTIKLNSRKILTGLLNYLDLKSQATEIIVEIDKLDKIGKAKVLENIEKAGVGSSAIAIIDKVLLEQEEGTIQKVANNNDEFAEGLKEVNYIKEFGISCLEVDFSLARGLDYYTGCIFEVKCNEYEIGSIGGGGRYDNLTEMFGKKDLTGVGISFGLERIYDIMTALNKFPDSLNKSSKIMFAHFDIPTFKYAYEVVEQLRHEGISAEVYPDLVKLKKQMKYANDKHVEFVCILGEEEITNKSFTLKEMKTGKQQNFSLKALIDYLKSN